MTDEFCDKMAKSAPCRDNQCSQTVSIGEQSTSSSAQLAKFTGSLSAGSKLIAGNRVNLQPSDLLQLHVAELLLNLTWPCAKSRSIIEACVTKW